MILDQALRRKEHLERHETNLINTFWAFRRAFFANPGLMALSKRPQTQADVSNGNLIAQMRAENSSETIFHLNGLIPRGITGTMRITPVAAIEK